MACLHGLGRVRDDLEPMNVVSMEQDESPSVEQLNSCAPVKRAAGSGFRGRLGGVTKACSMPCSRMALHAVEEILDGPERGGGLNFGGLDLKV